MNISQSLMNNVFSVNCPQAIKLRYIDKVATEQSEAMKRGLYFEWLLLGQSSQEAPQLEKQNELLNEQLGDIDSVNKQRVLRAKIAGKSEEEIYNIESEGREQRLAALRKFITILILNVKCQCMFLLKIL